VERAPRDVTARSVRRAPERGADRHTTYLRRRDLKSDTPGGLAGITALAADAADESERPTGLASGELAKRIDEQLRMVAERGKRLASSHDATSEAEDAHVVAPGSGAEGTAGAVVVEAGALLPSPMGARRSSSKIFSCWRS
jgi:hypothetical protein